MQIKVVKSCPKKTQYSISQSFYSARYKVREYTVMCTTSERDRVIEREKLHTVCV